MDEHLRALGPPNWIRSILKTQNLGLAGPRGVLFRRCGPRIHGRLWVNDAYEAWPAADRLQHGEISGHLAVPRGVGQGWRPSTRPISRGCGERFDRGGGEAVNRRTAWPGKSLPCKSRPSGFALSEIPLGGERRDSPLRQWRHAKARELARSGCPLSVLCRPGQPAPCSMHAGRGVLDSPVSSGVDGSAALFFPSHRYTRRLLVRCPRDMARRAGQLREVCACRGVRYRS